MNIFVLDKDPSKCAEYHCDKHVVKMILETAQLLCGAIIYCGESAQYKLTHKNHPCAKWTRHSLGNWIWLRDLGICLCKEYTIRYGKTHKCESIIKNLNPPEILLCRNVHFNIQAMPDQYKRKNTVLAYRNYYVCEKKSFAKWKMGNIPYWFK